MHRISRSQLIVAGTAAFIGTPRLAGSQTLAKVRFCGTPTDDLAPVFWAITKGVYAKAGLDVEFIPTSSGSAATTAIIAGTYDIGKASQLAACFAYLRGVPIAIVGNGTLWEADLSWVLGVVAADSTIKTGADLNGKTLAAAGLNDLGTLVMASWVDKNGGDSKTLRWVEIPGSAAGVAVAERRVSAAQLNEPQLRLALDTGKVKVLAPFMNAVSTRWVSTVFIARPEWARPNRAIVERFVRTTYETAVYTNSHLNETAPLVADFTKIPLDVIQRMSRARASTSSDPALVQPAIDVAVKYGQIARTFPARELYL